jgi:thiamine biosynthesis lipoprotein
MALTQHAVIAAFLLLGSAAHAQVPVAPPVNSSLIYDTFSHAAMATEFEIILYGRPGDTHPSSLRAIADEAFAAIDDLENRISNWKENSQVSHINRHAAEAPVHASPDVIGLIAQAKDIWRDTDGAFDISVGPLLDVWGFYRKEGVIPAPSAIQELSIWRKQPSNLRPRACGSILAASAKAWPSMWPQPSCGAMEFPPPCCPAARAPW